MITEPGLQEVLEVIPDEHINHHPDQQQQQHIDQNPPAPLGRKETADFEMEKYELPKPSTQGPPMSPKNQGGDYHQYDSVRTQHRH
jgi:hypothetical protein